MEKLYLRFNERSFLNQVCYEEEDGNSVRIKTTEGLNEYVTILLTQEYNDNGIFLDVDSIIRILSDEEIIDFIDVFMRRRNQFISNVLKKENVEPIAFNAEQRLRGFSSYKNNNGSTTYRVKNFNSSPDEFYTGIVAQEGDIITYVFDAKLDDDGSIVPNTGLIYKSDVNTLSTTAQYTPQGYVEELFNNLPTIKEEIFSNVVLPPDVNNIFINRGIFMPSNDYMRLAEIDSVEQFDTYGNGYYNVIKN